MKKEFLKYAERGWRVIPVEPRGKKPLIRDWPNMASTDEAVIEGWVTRWPDANVGILMGESSGVFALDIDVRNDGDITLAGLEARFGTLPCTLTSNTGGGGRHLIYRYPVGTTIRSTTIPDGIDVQSNGKFIVAPSSMHESGKTYEWVDFNTPIADAPSWLIELINKPKDIVVPSNREKQGNKKIRTGERNNTLAKLAGSMNRFGMCKETIEESLLILNEKMCEDPLPDDEVRGIVNSVARYDNSLVTVSNKINLMKLADMFSMPEEKLQYIVDDLLPCSGLSLLVGKPKTGKTTLARNLALCIASGRDFLERAVTQGSVLYFALEEKQSEVIKHFRDMGATGMEDIYVHVSGALYDSFDEVNKIVDHYKPHLIIIDPLFRFVSVKDGNDYNSVTRALDPLMQMARRTQAHVMCIHHVSKGDRQGTDGILGSTAIFGTIDTALILQRKNEQRIIYSDQRYGKNLDELMVSFDETTRTCSIGGTKEEAELKKMSKTILDFLSKQSEPLTEQEIDNGIEGRKAYKVRALRDLVADVQIFKEGKGGKGDPFKYSINACSLVSTINKEQENTNITPPIDHKGDNNE